MARSTGLSADVFICLVAPARGRRVEPFFADFPFFFKGGDLSLPIFLLICTFCRCNTGRSFQKRGTFPYFTVSSRKYLTALTCREPNMQSPNVGTLWKRASPPAINLQANNVYE